MGMTAKPAPVRQNRAEGHQRPPAPLSARSRTLWRDLLAANAFARHERELLFRALEAADVADEMSRRIAVEGLMVGDKPHPLLGPRRDALQAAGRWWRQLKFTSPAPAPRPGRPSGPGWHPISAAAMEARRDA
jgi:hypothetical protein